MTVIHTEYTDSELIKKLKNGTLPEELFNHEAHLRLAFIVCMQNDLEQAVEKTCAIILSYVRAIDATPIYDEALTHSAVRLVHDRIQSENFKKSFSEFINANPDLKSDFKELVKHS